MLFRSTNSTPLRSGALNKHKLAALVENCALSSSPAASSSKGADAGDGAVLKRLKVSQEEIGELSISIPDVSAVADLVAAGRQQKKLLGPRSPAVIMSPPPGCCLLAVVAV